MGGTRNGNWISVGKTEGTWPASGRIF